jgi:hypothetical protein
LVFKSAASALAYQNNVARLHKLASLHQSSSIFSAIPPPKGMLEDGEDLHSILSTYVLKPTDVKLHLNMVMQPYNPSLRALLERGGYHPIVPSVSENGTKLWKVLLHIQGWESSAKDLYWIFTRHAYDRGLTWPFHNKEHGIHRLRDLVDLKARLQPVSAANPRAANPDRWRSDDNPASSSSDTDPSLDFLTNESLEQQASEMMRSGTGNSSISQIVMNRVYNRWIVEFEEEDAARRFARMWNRRVLPAPKFATWTESEASRMVSAEFLW